MTRYVIDPTTTIRLLRERIEVPDTHRLTTTTVRLLNDRVSRAIAWKVATELGWDDTVDAEYVAVTRLQADALVAGGDGLRRRGASRWRRSRTSPGSAVSDADGEELERL